MNAKWGYISKSGKLVIAPSFDSAAPFAERLAAVKTGGLWGYINKTGELPDRTRSSPMRGYFRTDLLGENRRCLDIR